MPRQRRKRLPAKDIKSLISWYATWAVLALIIISILTCFFLSLPIWRIRSITVTGNDYLPQAKIIGTAKIPQGEKIFLVDLDEAKNRFSEFIQIKKVTIRRKLPDTIIIDVTERVPFAITVIGGATSLVDENGYIIAKQDLNASLYRLDVSKYPVIRGIDRRSLEGGIRLDQKDRSFVRSALSLLSKFMDIGTIQIEVGNREDIIIYIEDILKVKVGDTRDLERKIKIIKALLASVQGKWNKVAYIDARSPDNPAVMFK
ncbi:MAG: FtsQ-type POTRA domain-containing protein [bacterium]